MNDIPKIGVFLCECGKKIKPLVDLPGLEKSMASESDIECCETLPYPCLAPGLKHIISKVREKKLNRLVVAGCEGRLILKKFETALKSEGFEKGQIDVINLRGHVAAVSDISAEKKAEKGGKLIKAAVAEMGVLNPSVQTKISIDNPPIIVGGGVASFAAAMELSRHGIDSLLSLAETDTELILDNIYKYYPGERQNYGRLEKLIKGVKDNPQVKIISGGSLADFTGITGNYTISFAVPEETGTLKYKAGVVIACLDGELSPPCPESGYDGATILCQTDFEEIVWTKELPAGQTVFWINDYETGQEEFAHLSARSAWIMGKHIMQNSPKAKAVILYNEQMPLPLSTFERAEARKLGLQWIPYDKSVQPVLQSGYISFGSINDHLEHELPWDRVVLSPARKIDKKALEVAKILGFAHGENEFFDAHHARVRPEMVGREEIFFAGSARCSCDLETALSQGKKAGRKNAELLKKAKDGQLFSPRLVSVVDPEKCVGCGQCQELCDCNAISVIEGEDSGVLPRVVDPMVCTGGGTCVAACPYQALTLQNSTTEQREVRVVSLAKQMDDDEFIAFACSWSGLPAADNAGIRGLKYDHKNHILGVRCLGLIDPSVMAMAFLKGTPGLLLVGCVPEDCHHSFGVDHTWSRVNLLKKLFSLAGFNRQRIALAHADLNNSEEFIRTMENFSKVLATLGPIEKTPENIARLQSIYRLVKYNSRIRLLLSSGLRRPWETTYKGEQQYALAYDRDDFSEALKEEFLKARLEEVFAAEKRPFGTAELADILSEASVREQLDELTAEGIITLSYQEGRPFYTSID